MRIAVTGASRGLGRGMGERFLALGHRVDFARSLTEFEDENQLHKVGDITDAASLEAFYAACNRSSVDWTSGSTMPACLSPSSHCVKSS